MSELCAAWTQTAWNALETIRQSGKYNMIMDQIKVERTLISILSLFDERVTAETAKTLVSEFVVKNEELVKRYK